MFRKKPDEKGYKKLSEYITMYVIPELISTGFAGTDIAKALIISGSFIYVDRGEKKELKRLLRIVEETVDGK